MLPSSAPLTVAGNPPKLGRKTPMLAVLSSASLLLTGCSRCHFANPLTPIAPRNYGKKRPKAGSGHANLTLTASGDTILRRTQSLCRSLNQGALEREQTQTMPMDAGDEEPRKRLGLRLSQALHRYTDWVLSDPNPPPPDIKHALNRQSLTKPKTLVAAVLGSTLLAAVAAGMTGAMWAYVWLLAQLVASSIRLLVMWAFLRAEASGRRGNTRASVVAGLVLFCTFAAGCYQCVVSGDWPLILMAGVAIASLMGGVASRDAGTPRYGATIIGIMALPYAFAALRSPIPICSSSASSFRCMPVA